MGVRRGHVEGLRPVTNYCHADIQISVDVVWTNSPGCKLLTGYV